MLNKLMRFYVFLACVRMKPIDQVNHFLILQMRKYKDLRLL